MKDYQRSISVFLCIFFLVFTFLSTAFPQEIKAEAANTLQVGANLTEWVLDENSGYIYAVSESANKLFFIRLSDMQIESELIVGSQPSDIEMYNGKLYIPLSGSTQIAIVDIISKTIESTITVNYNPYRIAIDGNKLFYVEYDGMYLYEYDMTSVAERKITVGADTYTSYSEPDLTIDRTNHVLFIGETGSTGSDMDAVSTITYERLHERTSSNRQGFAFPNRKIIVDGGEVFYAGRSFNRSNILVINGTYPDTYSADILCVNKDYVISNLAVYERNTYRKIVELPYEAALAAITSTANVYLYNDETKTIYGYDSVSQINTAYNQSNPELTEWVLDENSGYIYAVSEEANKLLLINSSNLQVEKEIIVGSKPSDIELTNGKAYIPLWGSTKIAVVDMESKAMIDTIVVNHNPYKLAVDDTKLFYVEEDQHCPLYEYNLTNGTEQEIVVGNDTYTSYYQPNLEVDRVNHVLYIGESSSSGCDIDAVSTVTYDRLHKSTYDVTGFPNASRKIVLEGEEVFYAGHSLNKNNLAVINGKYPMDNNYWLAKLLSVKGDYVFSNNALYNRTTFTKIIDLPYTISLATMADSGAVYLYNNEEKKIYKYNVIEDLIGRSIDWNLVAQGGVESDNLYNISWVGNQYMALGIPGEILASFDGVNWERRPLNLGVIYLRDIIYANGQYVGVGVGGKIVTSDDGSTWVERTSGTAESLLEIAWNGSIYVAVGTYGTILTSADAVTWTAQTSGVMEHLRAITYGNDQFVAVGGEAGYPVIITSYDGVNWNEVSSTLDNRPNDVAWNGNQFVLVGDYGEIMTSTNGTEWTGRISGTNYWLKGVTTIGSQFVAVGEQGITLTSRDGITWTECEAKTTEILNSIVSNGTDLTAVGYHYTILTTETGIPSRPILTGITADIINSTITAGESTNIVATAVYAFDEGSIQTYDITHEATYVSSDPSIVSVDSLGVVTGVNAGQAEITVSYGGHIDVVIITVENDSSSNVDDGIIDISLDEDSYLITVGQVHQTIVTAVYSSLYGETQTFDVTGYATFTSTSPTVATISPNGLITAVNTGTTVITATYQSKTAVANVTVMSDSSDDTEEDSDQDTSEPIDENIDGDEVNVDIDEDQVDDLIDNSEDEIINIGVKTAGNTIKVKIPQNMIEKMLAANENSILKISSENGEYSLPVSSLNLDILARQLNTNKKNLKINLVIKKVLGDEAKNAIQKADSINAEIIADLIDFEVEVEDIKGKGKKAITHFGTYVSRTLKLNKKINSDMAVGVMYNKETNEYIPVPTTFEVVNGETIATIKRQGNSIYTVINRLKTFDDVQEHWANSDIEVLASKMIINGKDENTYDPDGNITRAEFISLLVRAMGIVKGEEQAKFNDVSDQWFAGEVEAAVQVGLIDGYDDGAFRPDKKISRQEMAAILSRAIEFAGEKVEVKDNYEELSQFNDMNNIAEWAKEAAAITAKTHIVQGKQGGFAPNANATRAEAAVMLKQMLEYIKFING